MSAPQRQSTAKQASAQQAAQQRPPLREPQPEDEIAKLLSFQASYGNQATQRELAGARGAEAVDPSAYQSTVQAATAVERPSESSSTTVDAGLVGDASERPADGDRLTKESSPAAAPPFSTHLIVDDDTVVPGPGQATKTAFLGELRQAVSREADVELAGTGRSTVDCPWIQYWFAYYEHRDAARIEQDMYRYAPEALNAPSVAEVISLLGQRVSRAVAVWATTGRVTGLPHEVPLSLPGVPGHPGANAPAAAPMPIFHSRPPASPAISEHLRVERELGEGTPLETSVRSRMESAFQHDFSAVRVHSGNAADRLTQRFQARAFTLGQHLAFAQQEYRPGTALGDALLAHELAHVVQQQASSATGSESEPLAMPAPALEADADQAAAEALAYLSGSAKGGPGPAARARTHLTSSLRLARCNQGGPRQVPKSLRHVSTTHNPDATWSYLTLVTYEVLDTSGNPISGFDVNEKFGSPTYDDASCDWRQSNEGGYTAPGTQFSDHMGGESSTHTPTPQSPQSPLGNHKVQHWPQAWYIGSTTPGSGTKVQTNTFQKYQDHADHENVRSPP